MPHDSPHSSCRAALLFSPACGAALWSPDTDDGASECTVVLSFDVDGSSGMINRDPRVEQRPSARSFGDYGPTVAVPHILTALSRAEVRASFYIPGWVAERNAATVEQIASAGHEIGHHGYLHEPPATLSAEEEADVLDKGSDILQGITGEAVVGYRSPSWELSDVSLALMSERGFRYDSSLMGSDAPYWVGAGESTLVELPIHWALDDYPYFVFAPTDGRRLQAAPEQVESTWRDAFDEIYRRGGVFTLTMHPYIIGRPGRVSMLERLIGYMKSKPRVTFSRAVDVCDQFAAEWATARPQ
ncbi:MAG: polysaccharide deacetylase [Chloroflexi bacterium]|nr:polysaccharide deacetylase [Chloroflexota bacterium]